MITNSIKSIFEDLIAFIKNLKLIEFDNVVKKLER